MMTIMIKSVKIFALFLGLALFWDYFYSTSNFALQRTHWLMSGIGTGNVDCSDTSPFDHVDLEARGRTWNVQYRFIDLKLIMYDPKTREMVCIYASKS